MRGCIERITDTRLSGWFIDDTSPDARVRIKVLVREQVIGEAIADSYRADLHANQVGDGQYGFVILTSGENNLEKLYAAGRVQVQCFRGDSPPFELKPSLFLAQAIRVSVLLEAARTRSFADFLLFLKSEFAESSGNTESVFHVLNASRAHFPEWRDSREFLLLARDAAQLSKKPFAFSFYSEILDAGGGMPNEASKTSNELESSSARSRAYAEYSELGHVEPKVSIRYVRPVILERGPRVSFLEEMGFFLGDPERLPTSIPLLAIKDGAFGDTNWWVQVVDGMLPVPLLMYYADFEQLLSVLEERGIVCLDMSSEGPVFSDKWNSIMSRTLSDLNIPRQKFLYITQNLAFRPRSEETVFAGRVEYAHFYISKGLSLLTKKYPSPKSISLHVGDMLRGRSAVMVADLKHYLCLNYTPRWHRWITALFLYHRQYLDRGLVSFPGEVTSKMKTKADLETFVPSLQMRGELIASVEGFLKLCPLTLDVGVSPAAEPVFQFPLELMKRSLFQIVTESEVGSATQRRITEKILKPIVGLQPFIIIGNPGSLDLLRSMGFKSFCSVFDESYDSIDDPGDRFESVFSEVDRLLQVSAPVLARQIEEISSTLIHNFVHLLRIAPILFGPVIEERLRLVIQDMSSGSD